MNMKSYFGYTREIMNAKTFNSLIAVRHDLAIIYTVIMNWNPS